MNHWWVNQNQTYKQEVEGGYLWSPKRTADGRQNRFYDSMTETRPGDVVFSFCDTLIKAIGIVSGPCQSAPKPLEFGSTGENWGNDGWYVPVEFEEINRPIRPKDHMQVLGPTLPSKYSPIRPTGDGNQGVYLAPVPPGMAAALRQLLNGQVEDIEQGHAPISSAEALAQAEQQRISTDATLPQATKERLIQARVGQGWYRSRVELIEPCCRITGVHDRRFLRASHIKPWAHSTDAEKLDGHNGLLLAPHVDHLFDRGFITFGDDGAVQISPKLPVEVWNAWSLKLAAPRVLLAQQALYMAYHRAHVFLH